MKDWCRAPRSGAIRVGLSFALFGGACAPRRGRGSNCRRPASACGSAGPARTADRRRHDPWFLQLPKEPIMSDRPLDAATPLAQLWEHLTLARYAPTVIVRYVAFARLFLRYLEKRHVRLDEVEPAHVSMYLACKLRRYRQRHGRAAASMTRWRSSHTAGIHQLLRVVRGSWPVAPAARSPSELYCDDLLAEFAQWLHAQRGLAARFHRRHGRRSASTSLVVQGQRRHDRSQGHAAR